MAQGDCLHVSASGSLPSRALPGTVAPFVHAEFSKPLPVQLLPMAADPTPLWFLVDSRTKAYPHRNTFGGIIFPLIPLTNKKRYPQKHTHTPISQSALSMAGVKKCVAQVPFWGSSREKKRLWRGPSARLHVCLRHVLNLPQVVFKGIYHCWTYLFCLFHGQKQMEGSMLWFFVLLPFLHPWRFNLSLITYRTSDRLS